MTKRGIGAKRRSAGKPYAMAGSGNLVSMIWKTGGEESGWRYRFNVFRQNNTGTVTQTFSPADLMSLVRLTRVLAAVLAEDGCLPPPMRSELENLFDWLDELPIIED